MCRVSWSGLAILFLGLAGCEDGSGGPAHAVPGVSPPRGKPAATPAAAPVREAIAESDRLASPPQLRTPVRYEGLTVEEWSTHLADPDRNMAWRAALALRVLGSEGRPYLIRALESSNAQTRFVALESLTLADFRSYGEEGRRLLMRLSGDRADFRIRERATVYLAQWRVATPAP